MEEFVPADVLKKYFDEVAERLRQRRRFAADAGERAIKQTRPSEMAWFVSTTATPDR